MQKANKIRRFLAIVAVLTSVLVIGTIAFRMHQAGAPKPMVPKLPVQVDVSLQRVHYTETKQGIKRWDLSADRAEFNKKLDVTELYGVRLVISGSAALGELQITADRADYHNDTRDVTLLGNVQGHGSKGLEFSTSSVDYIAARSLMQTSKPVRFVNAGLELQGVGMEFHTDTRRLRLIKDVNAVYRQQGKR
jgi:LPS export ABC transporter protein LptC